MSHYDVTKARIYQWIGIILIMAVFSGAYWYFKVYGSTLNQSQNDLNTNGLVGLWSFNGDDISGTTAYDRSGSGNNGTLTNGPTVTDGKVGQALSFNGSTQYVTAGDPANLDPTGSFSLSTWVKTTQSVSGGNYAAIAGKGFLATTNGYGLFLSGDDSSKPAFQTRTGATIVTARGPSVNDGNWHLLTGVRDHAGDTTYLYVDGQLAGTGTGALTNYTSTDPFAVGARFSTLWSHYYAGAADEVRFYNRILTAAEIQSLYDVGQSDKVNSSVSQPQGTGRLDSGLAGYWKMDDGSGTSATDSSTNGNTGTLTNGPTWTTGQIGGAVDLDGTDDYINLSTTHNYTSQDFSISHWAKFDSLTTQSVGQGPVTIYKGAYQVNGYYAQVSNAGAVSFITNQSGANQSSQTLAGTISTGTWYHMAYVRRGASVRIYINGVDSTTTVGTHSNPTSSGSNLEFGRYSSTIEMDGQVDELRVYDRALSVEEVRSLYQLTVPSGVDTSLKGYWSFNGKDISGTTAFDRSGVGNTGTLTNGPTKTVGPVGQALLFDGTNDYVHLGNNGLGTDLNGSTLVTLSAWIRPTAYPAGSARKRVISIDIGSSQTGLLLGLYNNSGNLLEVGARSQGGDSFQSVTVTGPSVNEWHFVSGVIDIPNDTISVYMDGALMKTQTVTFGASSYINGASPAPDAIGSFDGGAEYFTGSIDEARVYNRALSAGEIKALYDVGESDKVNSSVSQPQGTGRLDSGLAGYWKMDDGSGTSATDASTNGNTGTLTNGPTWSTGQVSGAVDFDGTNDYITVADTSTLDFGDGESFTLSAWFYRDTSGTYDSIIVKRNDATAGSAGYALIIYDSLNLAGFSVSDGTDVYYFLSNTAFTTPGWYHIAVTWDDSSESNSKLYVNAVDDTVSRTGTFASIGSLANAIPLGIGTYNGGHMFDGKIDEARVYNRVLSPDEIGQLYRLTAPTGTDTSLKGYWSFNGKDISGTTAFDQSGAGNNGTLTNSPTKTIGKIGQGLAFTASTNVVSTTTSTTTGFGTGDFSYGAWVKTTGYSNQGSSANTIIARGYLAQAAGFGIGFTSANTPVCYVSNDGTTSGGTALNDGQWHFVMLVRRSNVVECWQNGVKLTDGATTSNITSSESLNFGNDSAGPNNRGLVGKLDEVRLYNRALSASEVTTLYNSSR